MNRIVNSPEYVVEDMLQGFLKANRGLVSATHNPRVVKYAQAPVQGKVGIVTGGGSGHKPAFIGYIGKNMCDAVAVGEIFSSPTAAAFADAFEAADAGKGVACLYGNYAGDNMNVKMAIKKAAAKGITVKTVVANDDCASAPKDELEKRRGVAGEVLMWKVGGAKAAMNASLDEVIAAARKAIDNTRSVGIGTAPCTIPAVGHPNFTIEDGKMELGIGHHGEPGIRVEALKSADEIAQEMLDIIITDLPFGEGDEVVVLLSGLGATPVMEQYIVYSKVDDLLAEKGIHVYKAYVGNYFTSLEMMGVTLTVMKLDEELKACIDMPVDTVGLKQLQRKGGKAMSNMVFKNENGDVIVLSLIADIQKNKDYLSELDGKIGDGDHGINMNKGFTLCEKKLAGMKFNMSQGLRILAQTLMEDIGGSMGPLYGMFFDTLAEKSEAAEDIDARTFDVMLKSALAEVLDIGNAKRGDKTLLETLMPAQEAFTAALEAGKDFPSALEDMRAAAEEGWQSTKDMVAKIGRASRLGERSRGFLDPGASSCYIILNSMATSIKGLLK